MSTLTRSATLAQSVLAAIGGRGRGLEEDRPEEIEEEKTTAEADDETPAAEGDADEPDATADDEEPDAEGDTDETEANAQRIRRAEQGRIRAILTHPSAAANAGLAAELAFGATFYSAKAAGSLLASAGGGGSRLADRMKGKSPALGSSGSGGPKNEKQTVLAAVGNTIKAMHGRNRKGA